MFSVFLTTNHDDVQFHISIASVSIENDDTVTALIVGAEFRWQEGAGPAEVCVELQGLWERDVRVVLTPGSLTAQGLASHTHTSTLYCTMLVGPQIFTDWSTEL